MYFIDLIICMLNIKGLKGIKIWNCYVDKGIYIRLVRSIGIIL